MDNFKKNVSIPMAFASESEIKKMLNEGESCLTVWSSSYQMIDCSLATLEFFGVTAKEDFHKNYKELFPQYQPDGQLSEEVMRQKLQHTFEYGYTVFDCLFKKRNGCHVDCRIQMIGGNYSEKTVVCAFFNELFPQSAETDVKPEPKQTGNPFYLMRDLTEFYKYKEVEDIARQRLQVMLDSSPHLITILDEDCNVLETNAMAATIFNLSSKDEYINNFFRLTPPFQPDGTPSDEAAVRILRGCIKNGKAYNPEWAHMTLDGDPRPLEVHMTSVNLDGRDVIICHARDLRQERAMIAKLESAVEKANEASHAKSRFLSNMSHEIRTPMNAIIGMTSIAKNTDNITKKDYYLSKIKDASNLLMGIINQILDMSKIEANKMELFMHSFDFAEMIDSITSVLGAEIDQKKQKFSVVFDYTIPQFIICDEIRLSQVLTNLLTNAVKFTPENGVITLDIKREQGAQEEILCFEITDNGIGIPKEVQERVFGAFEQAELDTTRRFGGTGLGLAICKRILELMNGTISVSSRPNQGSSFRFTIPLIPGEASDKIGFGAAPEAGEFIGRRILIAEDMEINREILIALLESTGVEIDCAVDGEQVVQMFRAAPERYDLILMDLQMPEMCGITATRTIRELGSDKALEIPIVAMTANVFQENIDKCLQAGMNDHLGKPLDVNVTMKKLRAYLK